MKWRIWKWLQIPYLSERPPKFLKLYKRQILSSDMETSGMFLNEAVSMEECPRKFPWKVEVRATSEVEMAYWPSRLARSDLTWSPMCGYFLEMRTHEHVN